MSTATDRTEPLSGRMPREDERESANRLRRILATAMLNAGEGRDATVELEVVVGDRPSKVALHRSLSDLLLEMLRVVGQGDAVTLVPVHKRLTTQQAADILNVSRPHLVKLLEAGKIPFETVGRHRRVTAQDVFDYRTHRAAERDRALTELAENDADLI